MINPSGFSDALNDSVAEVKVAAQHFGSHAAIISAKRQQAISHQNESIMRMQLRGMVVGSLQQHEIMGEMGELKAQVKEVSLQVAQLSQLGRLEILGALTSLLDTTQDASMCLPLTSRMTTDVSIPKKSKSAGTSSSSKQPHQRRSKPRA